LAESLYWQNLHIGRILPMWQHCKIYQSISSLKKKFSVVLKSDIKSSPSATDPFFLVDMPQIPSNEVKTSLREQKHRQ